MGWWGGETLEEGGASDRVNGNENWGRVHGGRVNGRHQMVSQRDSGNSGGISLSVFEPIPMRSYGPRQARVGEKTCLERPFR